MSTSPSEKSVELEFQDDEYLDEEFDDFPKTLYGFNLYER